MLRTFEDLAAELSLLKPSAGNAIVIGVDGCGGAGKSTFAARLSEAWGGSAIVHTDDFAAWDCPLDWWPRLRDQVLIPLQEGRLARYQRYDWTERKLAEWHEIRTDRVILEGVSATRAEFRSFLAYRVWIDCPVERRLERGLERDGAEMEGQWLQWMADEDKYVARQQPRDLADLIVNGDPPVGHRENQFEPTT